MVEVLGNKLKINSIDIIPSNIDKYDEYLKVSEDETAYELVTKETVADSLHLSYDKNGCMNSGAEKLIDTSAIGVINFNVSESNPLVVTFPNRQQKTFTSISSLENTQTYIQNLFLKEDGTTYLLNNRIYHQSDEPNNASTNDIWYDLAQEPLKIYQRSGNVWIDFNDVFMGVINQDLNVSVYGSVNINGGWASNFSASNYFEFANPTTNMTSFVYKSKFRTGTLGGRQSILSSTKDFQGLADICIENTDNLIIWISSTGASTHDIASALLSPYSFQPNTIYWFEFAWDGLTYTTKISTDGINWTNLHSISSSLKPYWTTRLRMGNDQTGPGDIFKGSYYIPECSLTINDQLWWKGSDKHFSQNPYNNNFTTKSVDDIWVIDDVECIKVPNIKKVGNPTLNGTVLSGFTTTDYAQMPFEISPHNVEFDASYTGEDVWTFSCNFTCTDVTINQRIIGTTPGNNAKGFVVGINGSKLMLWISSNGSSWDIASGIAGITTLVNNKKYYIHFKRARYNDFNGYKLYCSTDFSTWTTEVNVASDLEMYTPMKTSFGIDQNNPLQGSIDLADRVYLLQNNGKTYNHIWSGTNLGTKSITHNLNIQDTSKYKADAKIICVNSDMSHSQGEIISTECYLNKDTISCKSVNLINKNTNVYEGTWATPSNWKFKYNIREL